ncbi:growth hormone secretagogue receptor type 1-like [Haliotis asinina]|uniref:growth hormone secretagogue receptor type 1-like n=1 Tax=Haliotis asinina TaxID=109174 RepID=UPI003531B63B
MDYPNINLRDISGYKAQQPYELPRALRKVHKSRTKISHNFWNIAVEQFARRDQSIARVCLSDNFISPSEMDASLNISLKSLLDVIKHLSHEDKLRLLDAAGNTSLNELFDMDGAWDTLKPLLKYTEYRVHKILMLYISPILVILGICGNFMSFFIMRQKQTPRSSTYTFLTSLAVADTMVLLVGLFPRWLNELTGFDVRFQANWLCKTMVLLGYFCSYISTWIVVAVTIERFLVVYYPLKVLGLYSVARARKIIGGLYALFLSLNIHFLWTVGLVEEEESYPNPVCGAVADYDYLITVIWPWLDAVIYCLLPFFTIGIFNVLIILKVRRTAKQRALLQKVCPQKQKATSLDTSFHLTWMLLTVSFAFLFCKLPVNISIIASVFLNNDDVEMLCSILGADFFQYIKIVNAEFSLGPNMPQTCSIRLRT